MSVYPGYNIRISSDCTCRIVPIGQGVTIEFCPMHDAAPKLLTACKAIRAMIEVRDNIPQTTDEVFRILHTLADDAIASASPGRAEEIPAKPEDSTEAKSS